MTIRQAIRVATDELIEVEDSSAIIYALFSHVLCFPVEHLWAHPDTLISHPALTQFQELVARAKKHEPLAYLLQNKEFFGLNFYVTQDVLIPRPESEEIVLMALDYAKHVTPTSIEREDNIFPTIIDVGTGSGCIAIAIAKHLPQAKVHAIDVSDEALKVATKNAATHHVTNITFHHGSLLEPLTGALAPQSANVIVANLPYISDEEYATLPLNVKLYEPELALRSGDDPDVLNRELVKQARHWLKPGGLLLYETTNGHIVKVDST